MPIYRKVNKDFFKKWSPEMAYVLGFFMADGNMSISKRNTHFISFYSADEYILSGIRDALKAGHKLSKRSDNDCFRLQIGSKEIFEDLALLGVTPNKAKRMVLPKVLTRFIGDFVRGYFDGDGNVWSGYLNKGRAKPTHSMQVAFTSISLEFLANLKFLLLKNGIRGGSLFKVKNKNCHRLLFSTLDALKLYEIMYNVPNRLCLERKKLVFERFMKMRV